MTTRQPAGEVVEAAFVVVLAAVVFVIMTRHGDGWLVVIFAAVLLFAVVDAGITYARWRRRGRRRYP